MVRHQTNLLNWKTASHSQHNGYPPGIQIKAAKIKAHWQRNCEKCEWKNVIANEAMEKQPISK